MPYGLGGDSHGKPKGFFFFSLHPRSVLGALSQARVSLSVGDKTGNGVPPVVET